MKILSAVAASTNIMFYAVSSNPICLLVGLLFTFAFFHFNKEDA